MKHLYRLILIMSFVTVLAACTDDTGVEEAADSDGEAAEAEGGDLTVAVPSDVVSLDPHGSNDDPSEQLRDVVYEGLLTQNEDLEITEALAEEWEQIDDVTWEFKLRENV